MPNELSCKFLINSSKKSILYIVENLMSWLSDHPHLCCLRQKCQVFKSLDEEQKGALLTIELNEYHERGVGLIVSHFDIHAIHVSIKEAILLMVGVENYIIVHPTKCTCSALFKFVKR